MHEIMHEFLYKLKKIKFSLPPKHSGILDLEANFFSNQKPEQSSK